MSKCLTVCEWTDVGMYSKQCQLQRGLLQRTEIEKLDMLEMNEIALESWT